MLRSHHRGRDSACPMAGRVDGCKVRGLDFSAATSIAAGFGEVLRSYRAMQQQSSAVGLG